MMGDNKKIIASLVLASLGLGALYLFRDEINEFLKNEVKVEKIKKEEEIKEKKKTPEDPWSSMTWDKLRALLGPRFRRENILEVYYTLKEDEKMKWRRAVVKSANTSLDKSFVYLDSRILIQVYPSLKELEYYVRRYARNEASFDELYEAYKHSLKRLYNIG